ncbi:MAG TPA: type II toxin-antitoxin system RelE/ParE family toxin [Bacteroidia bacterium]|nr:type II toxin-antitoxin system RelE/ParE family toxin [Bacteroidia bacterium]
MKYTVTIDKRVLKELEKINDPDYSKIKKAIFSLSDNPRPQGYKKLKGRPGYRIRQGDYRIIYEIHDHVLIIDVIALGHRKDIYE